MKTGIELPVEFGKTVARLPGESTYEIWPNQIFTDIAETADHYFLNFHTVAFPCRFWIFQHHAPSSFLRICFCNDY